MFYENRANSAPAFYHSSNFCSQILIRFYLAFAKRSTSAISYQSTANSLVCVTDPKLPLTILPPNITANYATAAYTFCSFKWESARSNCTRRVTSEWLPYRLRRFIVRFHFNRRINSQIHVSSV